MGRSTTNMEKTIMASVRMSDSLRSKIKDNFIKQIRTAYSNSSELQPFVQTLINTSISDEELKLIKRDLELSKDIWEYKNPGKDYSKLSAHDLKYNTSLHFHSKNKVAFILNANRPDSEDSTFLTTKSNGETWHKSYYSRYQDKTTPVTMILDHDVSTIWSSDNDEPELKYPIIISKQETLDAISTYAEGTLKIDNSIETMHNLLQECTTLKRFLDAWPAGKDCVPQDVLNKQFAEAKPRTGPLAPKFNAATLLPDEIKEQMNGAILTSKLLS
jgi:hypothetical protein